MFNSSIPFNERIAGASLILVLSTGSFVLNLFLMAVFMKNHKAFKRTPFFLFALQIIIGDLLVILAQLIVAVPIIYAGAQVYPSDLPKIVSLGDAVGYTLNLYFAIVLVFNRLFQFCFSSMKKIVFGRTGTVIIIISVWAIILTRTIGSVMGGCVKDFDATTFHFYFDCNNPNVILFAKWSVSIVKYESIYVPIAMFCVYIFIILWIRVTYQIEISRSPSKYEKRLLYQSFFICGSLLCEAIAFAFVRKYSPKGKAAYFFAIGNNIIIILNSSMHAIILFCFNQDIKTKARRMFHRRQSSQLSHVQQKGKRSSTR